DSVAPEVQQILGFNLVIPVKTVYDVLESYGAEHVLEDRLIAVATQEIIAEGRPRAQVQNQIKLKERAIEYLSKNYCTPSCSVELIRQCLYSIGDNHAFLRHYRDPCDKMISFLTLDFDPNVIESDELSLSINSGYSGSRLSHSHANQYYYVFQTLTLWRDILHEFYYLWSMSDADLLSPKNYYKLRDTGQGLNRIQSAPKVSRAIHTLLQNTQKKMQRWIGSSVIHLGDKNVPNAFMFIDKYNQIATLLNPIVRCIEYINEINASTQSSSSAISESIRNSKELSDTDSLDIEKSPPDLPSHFSSANNQSTALNSKDSVQTTSGSATPKSRFQSVFSGKFSINPFDLLSNERSKRRNRNNSGDNDSGNKFGNIDRSAIRAYIDYAFGSPVALRKLILADFFKHGFDGSGADNFFDAGSCIDGRLTSAWNWCSMIEKKSYFPVFLLSGFVGFNGEPDR
ncbi:hypothetical protein BB560_005497, partial [Smittium megazygosporum]